ncbi:Hsp90B [Blastocladiella britannica]|nr:Hsp90B [Blastocladiella britannica]
MRPTTSFRVPLLAVLGLVALLATVQSASAEEYAFQTEVSRVMDIIIHSLYKTKEIFLRELISNASDAVDKARFLGITDKSVFGENSHLNITIEADKENRWLTIQDSGIGMTKDDLKNNLGTIAKSGTADFVAALETAQNKADLDLIGQFGVGFYSAFLVADKVHVTSKHPKDPVQHVWESTDASKYSLYEDPAGATLGRGTRIRLHLKEEANKYLDEATLRDLIRKYSEMVQFPIYLRTTKTIEMPAAEKEPTADKDDAAAESDPSAETDADTDSPAVEDAEAENEPPKMVSQQVQEWEQVNTNKPLWLRSPGEVEDVDYSSFFKTFFKETEDPAAHIHFRGEGDSDFKAMLFIPKRPPNNLMTAAADSFLRNIKLFVRRVFITDELIDFLPRYLSFLKGVIDSDDFPLNVSRETVQKTRLMRTIKNKVVSKTLQQFRILANNETSYAPIYKAYSASLKMGVLEDTRNRLKLVRLLRFQSTANADGTMTSLDGYLERMRKGQKGIYFLTGNDIVQMRKSPYLEALVTRGYEVLLMDDQYDEYVTQNVNEYEDVKLINVGRGALEFGDEDDTVKEAEKKSADEFQPLTSWLTDQFKDFVDKTIVSNRLTTSPCALVAPEGGWTGRMQEIMDAQKAMLANSPSAFMFDYYSKQKKILEINPKHPIMVALLDRVEDDKADDADTRDLARSLLDLAMIKGGFPIKDLDGVSKRIETAVRLGLQVDLAAKANVDVKAAPSVEPVQPKVTSDPLAGGGEEDAEYVDAAAGDHDEL